MSSIACHTFSIFTSSYKSRLAPHRMLEYLKLKNIGPAEKMELEFGSRFNILTGDNGLGKSFLLDAAWYVQTGCWPAEVNANILGGKVGKPRSTEVEMVSKESERLEVRHLYSLNSQSWNLDIPRNSDKTLSIYLMSDGSCSVFDPFRNESYAGPTLYFTQKPKAFVFNPTQVWNGYNTSEGRSLCNGLIQDWANWQNRSGRVFELLVEVLKELSPSEDELIAPGELTRISVDDVRDIPSIKMPYDGEVPIVHASSGIRRILTLAYMIVWAWEEHKQAAKQLSNQVVNDFCILIDEVDAHLHPSWQRQIIPSILKLEELLGDEVKIQIVASTHSPLIMSSLEPIFDKSKDAWFDIDLVGQNGHRKVELVKREFQILGDANSWLTSDAFDLDSTVSLEAERIMADVEAAMTNANFDYAQAKVLGS